MSKWVVDTVGIEPYQVLHRTLTRYGFATPPLPSSLVDRVVVGSDGWQVTTDPRAGSPYLCKSFSDDFTSEVHLFETLRTRTDPYFLFGQYSGGINTYFAMVVRCADFAVLVNCYRRDSVNRFVAACAGFLETHWADRPLDPIRHWVWVSNNGRLHHAERMPGAGTPEGVGYLEDGWSVQTVTDDLEVARLGLAALQHKDVPSLRAIASLGAQTLEPPSEPAQPAPAPIDINKLAATVAETATSKAMQAMRPFTNLPLSRELIELISWRLFSELIRRYPTDVALYMDWYPSGAPMMSAVRTDGSRRISLNHGASLHAWGETHYVNGGYIWHDVVQNGIAPSVGKMAHLLGLPALSGKPPSTTHTSIGPRLLAAVLAQTVLSTRRVDVQPVTDWSEWSTPPGGEDIFDHVRRLELHRQIDSIRVPNYWAIRDHQRQVRALVSSEGQLVQHDGVQRDLLAAYKKAHRNLPVLAAEIAEL